MLIKLMAIGLTACSALALASSAQAAPVITSIGADLSSAPYVFNFQGATFDFGYNGEYYTGPITVSSANGGEFNTIFGQPTAYFTDGRGGPVVFDSTLQYAAIPTQTPVDYSNGGSFYGLSADIDNQIFYGYAYTLNNILETVGFENVANTPITATTAVPEPGTWAMMLLGLGLVGLATRRRPQVPRAKVSYA